MILHVVFGSSLVITETSQSRLAKQSSVKKIFNSSFLTVEMLSGSLGTNGLKFSATQKINAHIKKYINYVQS